MRAAAAGGGKLRCILGQIGLGHNLGCRLFWRSGRFLFFDHGLIWLRLIAGLLHDFIGHFRRFDRAFHRHFGDTVNWLWLCGLIGQRHRHRLLVGSNRRDHRRRFLWLWSGIHRHFGRGFGGRWRRRGRCGLGRRRFGRSLGRLGRFRRRLDRRFIRRRLVGLGGRIHHGLQIRLRYHRDLHRRWRRQFTWCKQPIPQNDPGENNRMADNRDGLAFVHASA